MLKHMLKYCGGVTNSQENASVLTGAPALLVAGGSGKRGIREAIVGERSAWRRRPKENHSLPHEGVGMSERTARLREVLERKQIPIYFGALAIGALTACFVPGTTALEAGVNPALAVMLFATFLQVPLAHLGRAFTRARFLVSLLAANFVAVPLLVAILMQLAPDDTLARLGILLVLLAPCIDYVVTFSHLGRADSRLLLAATPALLVAQMLLLPVYLNVFLGDAVVGLVHEGPFVDAFVWLIAVPLVLAALAQAWARFAKLGGRVVAGLGLLPVPSTALVLVVVVAAVAPRLSEAGAMALRVVPVYVAFAVTAPLLGWSVGRLFRLEPAARRAVAFSTSTRNSLVVLPLALAVPGAMPVLPAIVVTQTVVELLSEVLYVRLLPKLDEI